MKSTLQPPLPRVVGATDAAIVEVAIDRAHHIRLLVPHVNRRRGYQRSVEAAPVSGQIEALHLGEFHEVEFGAVNLALMFEAEVELARVVPIAGHVFDGGKPGACGKERDGR